MNHMTELAIAAQKDAQSIVAVWFLWWLALLCFFICCAIMYAWAVMLLTPVLGDDTDAK
jgi:hypothetical protein